MKNFASSVGIIFLIYVVLVAVLACGELQPRANELETRVSKVEEERAALEKENRILREIAGPLPDSLDKYFPPQAEGPVYLFEMFALSGPFEGIIVDLQQKDTDGVQANYEAFKAQYQKLAGMVPEWKERYPMEPVDALGTALATGDPAKIGPSLEKVGKVCGSCHIVSQTKAHQKYHWKDFEEIKLADPLTRETLSLHSYMERMAAAFGGIGNDLRQGQLDNARKNYQAFNARFDALAKNACKQCHQDRAGKEIPRTYFVDESVKGMIGQLGQVLSSPTPDAEAIGKLSGAIGNESCFKCHLVHFPAAQAKERWEKLEELLE